LAFGLVSDTPIVELIRQLGIDAYGLGVVCVGLVFFAFG
jgi:hypothetical protein